MNGDNHRCNQSILYETTFNPEQTDNLKWYYVVYKKVVFADFCKDKVGFQSCLSQDNLVFIHSINDFKNSIYLVGNIPVNKSIVRYLTSIYTRIICPLMPFRIAVACVT